MDSLQDTEARKGRPALAIIAVNISLTIPVNNDLELVSRFGLQKNKPRGGIFVVLHFRISHNGAFS